MFTPEGCLTTIQNTHASQALQAIFEMNKFLLKICNKYSKTLQNTFIELCLKVRCPDLQSVNASLKCLV